MTANWKKPLCLLTVGVMSISLTACEMGGQKEAFGTLGGAVLGGLAGSQFGDGRGRLIATGLGTLLGAAAGSQIGKSLDRADQLYLERTTQQTLESAPDGQVSEWVNPNSGNSGTIVPQATYQDQASGRYCREFQQTVTIGNEVHDAYGTACRQPDGDWEIIS